MISKSRKRLIEIGMLDEYNEWKQNLSKKPTTFPPPLGTKVRFKRDWGHTFGDIKQGTEGVVVCSDWANRDNLLCVRPINWLGTERAHILKQDIDSYVEYI